MNPPPPPPSGTAPQRKPYEPPAIVWDDPYEALAQISAPPCIPGQDPRCTP